MHEVTTDLVDQLRTTLDGRVTIPADSDYDSLRQIVSGNHDRRPAVIIRPRTAADVSSVVTLAQKAGASVAVRSGGHSMAGHSSVDGGVVIDLRDMNDIQIDPGARTAWAEAGATAGQYTTAAGEHGLATGFGDTGSVGVGGITLAGGAGFLSRRYGLTIDNLLAAEIVTADGEIRQVDENNYPDLSWAIRGGGGNFGVVTKFKYLLRDVSEFTGGMLILPATPEVLAGFVAAAKAAPDELSTIMMAMVAPPMPFLPEDVHGKFIVMGLMGFVGRADDAEKALAPFRALATPLADMVQPSAYTAMFPPEEAEQGPTVVFRTEFIDSFDTATAAFVLEHLRTSNAPMAVTQFRVLGGAVARVPNDATAYAHRDRMAMVNVAAMFADPADRAERESWVTTVANGLAPAGGAYTGFLGDDVPDGARQAYPGATWDRLLEIKRRLDPTNMFRHNHNISVG